MSASKRIKDKILHPQAYFYTAHAMAAAGKGKQNLKNKIVQLLLSLCYMVWLNIDRHQHFIALEYTIVDNTIVYF